MLEEIEDLVIIRKIKKSNLIGRCIKFAKRGKIEQEEHAFNTSYHAKNSIGNLEVIFADGVNYQGDGYIIVNYGEETVFDASVNYNAKNPINHKTPPLNITREFAILRYIPGNWEDLIK